MVVLHRQHGSEKSRLAGDNKAMERGAVIFNRSYLIVFQDFSQMEETREELLIRIGGNVKRLRLKKRLSLRELSYLCAIDNSKISKIESGQFNITIATLLEVATALEVSAAELLKPLKAAKKT